MTHHLNHFYSPREGANLWADHDANIAAWRRGAQLDVQPLTLEYAPILACNADCPLCPYKKSRDAGCKGVLPPHSFAAEDGIASSTRTIAEAVLNRAREAGVRGSVFTGGGEPLKWSLLTDMLAYSRRLGMVNGLYSNGIELGRDSRLAADLLSPSTGLAFVRLSINTVSDRATKIHWGLPVSEMINQWIGLERLIEARNQRAGEYRSLGRPLPSIQVSTIVDKNTVDDLPDICALVARTMAKRVVQGSADVMVVRPLTIHGRKEYSGQDHGDSVISKIIASCGMNGVGRHYLVAQGVRLFLGFGLDRVEAGEAESYSNLVRLEYARRHVSLANGLFLTVGPDGSVYPSTEYNCKHGYDLGNLRRESVDSIWKGFRRREILGFFNLHHWGPSVAQPTARTNRLDEVADAVQDGRLTTEDIAAIKEASRTSPPLLLD